MDSSIKLSIKSWAEDDRPREKLLNKGINSLSDAELIAILIGSGNKEESAVELSKKILNSVNNDLLSLGKLDVKELQQFNGIGEAKAISIVAACELARRRKIYETTNAVQVVNSGSAANVMIPLLADLPHEEFWILLLNRANKVIQKYNISRGGVAATVVDTKLIFKKAILELASAIILVHNHPSGNLKASQADIQLTKKIQQAAKPFDIDVLDHLIIAGNSYFSFADNSLL